MKAARFHQTGGPEVLIYEDVKSATAARIYVKGLLVADYQETLILSSGTFYTSPCFGIPYLGRLPTGKAAQPTEFASARLMPIHQQQDRLGFDGVKPVRQHDNRRRKFACGRARQAAATRRDAGEHGRSDRGGIPSSAPDCGTRRDGIRPAAGLSLAMLWTVH